MLPRPAGRLPFAARAGGQQRREFAEAERLLRAGEYAQAADTFERLAAEAEQRSRPEVAAGLLLRAARCHAELGNQEAAGRHAERALRLFVRARRPARVRQLMPLVLTALERQGRQADAEALRREIEGAFPALAAAETRAGGFAGASLPTRCPNCGGPLRADEVSWSGAGQAECPYCGAVVRAG